MVSLDLSGVVAGTKYRGEFEERLKAVIDEIREHGEELIVFLDELHTVVGAGGAEGAMDAGNMLKPALARGELHVVGATTLDEYRKQDREGRRAGAPVPAGAWCPSRPWTRRSRSCAGCATGTRRTTRCATRSRRWSRRPSCRTGTSPTGSCRTRRST